MRHKEFRPLSKITAIRLSTSISIILNAIMLLGYIIHNRKWEPTIETRRIYIFFTDVILLYSLYMFNFKTIQRNWNRHFTFWIIIIGSSVIAVVLSLIFSEGAILLFPASPIPVNFQIIANIIKDLIVVMIVLLSTSLLYSIDQRQLTLFENEKLIAVNIRIRYEVLKNQVDPHFLFNSLNTLDGLIGIDDEKAHEYVQNLSQVFRYTIGNKEIMHLDEELDFTESYARLMKIRYGDNLQIKYNIDDKYRNYYIIPVSLQLLVENAIKHNVVSSKHPLLITIETTSNESIRVTNTIQPKSDVEHGEGIGLANLIERYELLFHKEVIITKTNIFCVEIPLNKQQVDHPIKNTKQK